MIISIPKPSSSDGGSEKYNLLHVQADLRKVNLVKILLVLNSVTIYFYCMGMLIK